MRNYLKEQRKELGMTLLDVAIKLDITESYYSLIENGERQLRMSIEMAEKISKALDIPIETILENERKLKQGCGENG